jgi:hypothetical protein
LLENGMPSEAYLPMDDRPEHALRESSVGLGDLLEAPYQNTLRRMKFYQSAHSRFKSWIDDSLIV